MPIINEQLVITDLTQIPKYQHYAVVVHNPDYMIAEKKRGEFLFLYYVFEKFADFSTAVETCIENNIKYNAFKYSPIRIQIQVQE